METITFKSLILFLVICFVIFLLLREVNLWYWKINRRIELQEETNRLLNKIIEGSNIKEELKKNKDITPSMESISVNNPEVLEELINRLKNNK